MFIVTLYQVNALGPLVLNYDQWFRRRCRCRNISSQDGVSYVKVIAALAYCLSYIPRQSW